MKVIGWMDFIKNGLPLEGKKTSMTVGVFDGVHRGHQTLIRQVVSHNVNYIPAVVTFRQSADKTIPGFSAQRNIQSFQERLAVFESLGIKITIVVDFTEEFMQMPGIEFLEVLAENGSVGFFAVGNNFRCGCRLDTSAETIKIFFVSRNIPVEIVPEVCYPAAGLPADGLSADEEKSLPISSSRIRTAIAAGDILLAQAMLGRN